MSESESSWLSVADAILPNPTVDSHPFVLPSHVPLLRTRLLWYFFHSMIPSTLRHTLSLEPGGPTRAEYTVKLEALAHWDLLDDEDLRYDDVRRVTSSPRTSGTSTA